MGWGWRRNVSCDSSLHITLQITFTPQFLGSKPVSWWGCELIQVLHRPSTPVVQEKPRLLCVPCTEIYKTVPGKVVLSGLWCIWVCQLLWNRKCYGLGSWWGGVGRAIARESLLEASAKLFQSTFHLQNWSGLSKLSGVWNRISLSWSACHPLARHQRVLSWEEWDRKSCVSVCVLKKKGDRHVAMSRPLCWFAMLF